MFGGKLPDEFNQDLRQFVYSFQSANYNELNWLCVVFRHDRRGVLSMANNGPDSNRQSSYRALRLANNELTKLDMIINPIISLKFDPLNILWLDLSFNAISGVSETLAEHFPNLTTLYLHANKISKLSDIRKLSGLTKLRSLTMYGNPVEDNIHYRNMMIYAHPEIIQIDFCTITQRQRDQVQLPLLNSCGIAKNLNMFLIQTRSWGEVYRRKLNPEPDEYA